MTEKILIGVESQSNGVRRSPNANWSPCDRAFMWNNVPGDGVSVGTAFVPLATTGGTIGESIASTIAAAKPDAEVYVVTCGKGGADISHWQPGGSPDIYATFKANIEAALTALGKTEIDHHVWWQGETGGEIAGYTTDLVGVINRLRGETWMSSSTPLVFFGTTDATRGGDTKYTQINHNIRNVAALFGAVHVPTAEYDTSAGSILWETDGVHLTGHGYTEVGRIAANKMLAQESGIVLNTFKPFVYGLSSVGTCSYDTQEGVWWQDGPTTLFTAKVKWSGHTGSGVLCLGDQLPFLPPLHSVNTVFFQTGYAPVKGLTTRLDTIGRHVVFDGNAGLVLPASGQLQFSGSILTANA